MIRSGDVMVQGDLGGIFPQQVGPPSAYAKTIQHWMHMILVLQAALRVEDELFF